MPLGRLDGVLTDARAACTGLYLVALGHSGDGPTLLHKRKDALSGPFFGSFRPAKASLSATPKPP